MNYEWVFSFVVFAEHMSFTRAARALHLSQPALHVQIRKLCEAVGRPLYRREGRALALTEEGKRLAAFGRQVQERGRAVLQELRGEALTGPVVLASGPGAFSYLLGPAIRRFPKSKWSLRLLSMAGAECIAALREARAHLAVVATEEVLDGFSAVRLRAVRQAVVLPSAHRLARRKRLRPRDLDGEPLVVAPGGSAHRGMLAQLFRSDGCELCVAVEATGWDLMLRFAKLGIGLAIVNDFCPPPPGMVAVPLEGAPTITYRLLSRGGFASPATEALQELIVETVKVGTSV